MCGKMVRQNVMKRKRMRNIKFSAKIPSSVVGGYEEGQIQRCLKRSPAQTRAAWHRFSFYLYVTFFNMYDLLKV